MHLPRGLTELSLISGPLHAILIGGALLALAGLLLLRRSRAWWIGRVPLAIVVTAGLLTLAWWVVTRIKTWPDGFPPAVLAWSAAGVLGLVLLALGWPGQRWRGRFAGVAAAVVVLLGAADGIDSVYGALPSVATALQLPPYDATGAAPYVRSDPVGVPGPLWQTWRQPARLPGHGEVFQVAIPPTLSGFPARPAWVYLPPAGLTRNPPALPLLVMIGGQPGGPRDWLDGGRLAQVMDAWAATHRGMAPIVVMPDGTGGETANPLCMDSALGRADAYLAQDVPAWATRTLPVTPDRTHWAVGGFSYGGTCALQLAVAHPALFPTFFDTSGQESPTLGSRARTVAATFGGDAAAFAAVDPLTQLGRRMYPGSAAFLVVGAQDSTYRPQQDRVAAAARAAGMDVQTTDVPGEHSWSVWRPALVLALPWLAVRIGLAP